MQLVLAEGQPGWITEASNQDPSYVYFVGFGQAERLSDATNQARADAKRKLVEQARGVYLSFDSSMNEDQGKLEFQAKDRAFSDLTHVKGLEEVDSFSKEESEFSVWILLRIPKAEYTRISSRVENQNTDRLANLKVDSIPSGAEVRINNLEKGKTPIQFLLPPGSVTISISKAGYDAIRKKVDLLPRSEIVLSETLTETTEEVQVNVNPSDANIYWNGEELRYRNSSSFQTGPFHLRVEAEGYLPVEKRGVLKKGSPLNFDIALKVKKARAKAALSEANIQSELASLLKKGKYQKAFEFVEDRKSDLSETAYYIRRAEIYWSMGQPDEGYSDLEKAKNYRDAKGMSIDVGLIGSLCIVGSDALLMDIRSDFYRKNLQKIVSECDFYKENSPADGSIYFAQGNIKEAMGNWRGAKRDYITMKALEPSYAPVLRKFCKKHKYDFLIANESCP